MHRASHQCKTAIPLANLPSFCTPKLLAMPKALRAFWVREPAFGLKALTAKAMAMRVMSIIVVVIIVAKYCRCTPLRQLQKSCFFLVGASTALKTFEIFPPWPSSLILVVIWR